MDRVGHFLCALECVALRLATDCYWVTWRSSMGSPASQLLKLFSAKVCNKFVNLPRVFRTQATTTTVGVHSYPSSGKPGFARGLPQV